MCLILLGLNKHPGYPLILAANRDEYFSRPTRFADYWEDAPWVIGGRDLEAGGSWLGLDVGGRLAAVTNVREPPLRGTGAESRGRLVSDFLTGETEITDYLQEVIGRRHLFDPYNLLVGTAMQLYFHSSGEPTYQKLEQGIHGISNGRLDANWPKVVRGRAALSTLLEAAAGPQPDDLLAILADTHIPDDGELPDTGVGLERERALAPICVRMDGYGTRSSTVIMLGADGRVLFRERSFSVTGEVADDRRFEFQLQ